MKPAAVIAICALLATPAALAQSPADAMKGKMKPGMYSYKMEMDMGQVPGAPPGMGKQTMNMQHCLTDKDIADGQVGRGRDQGPKNCEMKDFRMSGSTATYKMVCKGEFEMVADNTIHFVPDGFNMNMKMQMDRGGQKMNMTQNMEAKYLGACTK
jgi:hypothetical protein